MAELPIRHHVCRCEGCGNDFVECNPAAVICPACLAAGKQPLAQGQGDGAAQSAAVVDPASTQESGQSHLRIRTPEPDVLGLPPKITWSSPPFQVGWDDVNYPNQSDDELPARKAPSRGRRRMLLALLGAVAVLALMSRLDAPSVELVWRERSRAKSTEQKRPVGQPMIFDKSPRSRTSAKSGAAE